MAVPPLFLPEGHIDKALTRALLGNRRNLEDLVNRKQGASGVANEMMRQWEKFGPTRRVVGIVDDDKKIFDVKYLAGFGQEIRSSRAAEASHSIRRHTDRPGQYLVMLAPACDTWVWQAAVDAGLPPPQYGLPAPRMEFVSYCKSKGKEVGQDPSMRRLLADIQRTRPVLFEALAEFVADIMDLDHPLP